jgi:hypothetical protein
MILEIAGGIVLGVLCLIVLYVLFSFGVAIWVHTRLGPSARHPLL